MDEFDIITICDENDRLREENRKLIDALKDLIAATKGYIKDVQEVSTK